MRILKGNIYAVLAKVVFVTIAMVILGFLMMSAFGTGDNQIAIFLAVCILILAFTYFTNISVPLKFFAPGIMFLAAFVIVPMVFTLSMAGFKYQTGNMLSKEDATSTIIDQGTSPDENGTAFDAVVGYYGSDKDNLAILGSDTGGMTSHPFFIATKTEFVDLTSDQVTVDEWGVALEAPDFTTYTDSEVGDYSDIIGNIRLKYEDPYFIRIDSLPMDGVTFASVNIQNYIYDKETDTFSSVLTGATFKDDGKGNYRNPDNAEDYLEPGWRVGVWFENFSNLLTEPKIREPLIQVFIWTILFAVLTVITQFSLGLLVALAMDKKVRGRGIYRSLMILPYAMPSIMSILIWGGMLDDNGAINSLLGSDISWLHDPFLAKISVLLVNLWLGFPYFYLICAGSLQAIPKELAESASIDGAHPRQIFRLITLPLLLRMLTPLLIASFAFNFNNFNIIYLLTGGGPSFEFGGIAGATDILISYTYKLAFDTTVQNYGLASAISVVIFVIVASISMYGIRKSKVLDDFA